MCEQLAQGRYLTAAQPGVELTTSRVASQHPNHYTTRPHYTDQATNKITEAENAELTMKATSTGELPLAADRSLTLSHRPPTSTGFPSPPWLP